MAEKRAEGGRRGDLDGESPFRSLIENVSETVTVVDSELVIRYISPSVERVLGYGPERVIGRSPLEFIHPDDREGVEARLRERFTGPEGEETISEVRFIAADGGWRLLEVHGRKHLDPEGEAIFILTSRDVTEQRRSEEELRRQRAYFARLFDGSPEAIVLLDSDDIVQRINREFTRLFGYTAGEAQGRHIDGLIVPPDRREESKTLSERAVAGERVGLETVRQDRHGQLIDVSILAVPVDFEDGTTQIYGIYRDISARKRAEEALAESEEQLRQAQKMEAVGRLAGGIAHDFNNFLTAIKGHSQLLIDALDPADPLREDVEEIWSAAERATSLTRQLLAFSRKQILNPKPVDLNEVIQGLEVILSRLIGEGVELVFELESGLGLVYADPGQLELVIMNLAVNAHDAMRGQGRLTIGTEAYAPDLAVGDETSVPITRGGYLLLSVEDTGTGMSEEVRARIFEPFFTTKPQGEGTGLGLSMVYGIVQQSGGFVEVESQEAAGTRLEIYLPLLTDASLLEERDLERSGSAGGESVIHRPPVVGGKVLVVEDEEAVRALVCKVLEREGFEVLSASNGGAALELLESSEELLQLIITDIVMPEMDGTELAERVRCDHPEVRLLFMSGYAEDELVKRGLATRWAGFLEKPFSPRTLIERVRELLAVGATEPKPFP